MARFLSPGWAKFLTRPATEDTSCSTSPTAPIPNEVTIGTVADAFDAMVHERPYRAERPVEEGIAEIVRCRGNQFNPAVVDALVPLHQRGALPDQANGLRTAALARRRLHHTMAESWGDRCAPYQPYANGATISLLRRS